MTTDLVKSVSIENMVGQRQAVVERLQQACDLLKEAERIAVTGHLGFPRIVIEGGHFIRGGTSLTGFGAGKKDAMAEMSKVIDAEAWRYLLSESGLRSLMDATARDKWNKAITEGDFPELTAVNVKATFNALHEARGDMFERGVIESFRRLSWEYKTNLPALFGKRIIVHLFSKGCINHRVPDELDDLMRVFHVMDCKPEADHRDGIYYLVSHAWRARESQAENEYLALKWFKKGTAHVVFKRTDLVEKMNRIIAKHYPDALPRPAR
ncbi:hypothetical protein LMG7143_04452 [Ralstonia thomasii]|uniref:DUF4942 domain-containing protein n=1 Tax=Ralstonia thomasii TaxID=3058596 RepID=UPI0028F64131|nr:DUF4942 domain-containing protein [Ralstonia sp. LMG 18095]CAJ0718573.1 hypothetical protein LMG7143_04452 [Ralstonia sp. LMG 18095]